MSFRGIIFMALNSVFFLKKSAWKYFLKEKSSADKEELG